MFPWNSRRRSASAAQASSRNTPIIPPPTRPVTAYDPPRYSHVYHLEQRGPALGLSEQVFVDADEDDSRTVASLGSQLTSPTYVSIGGLRSPFGESAVTLTTPPRYSNTTHRRSHRPEDERAVPLPNEFLYHIRSGLKSNVWATLRLYDAEIGRPGTSRPRKNPRVSNVHNIFGNVEITLTSPQTIKSINVRLKGTMITSASTDSGSLTFLDHTYPLWDRKFGDPRELAHPQSMASVKRQDYDGKLDGNWIFPFSIPFPTHTNLSTLRAVYPAGSEGPVRFLPVLVDSSNPISPFPVDGPASDRLQERSAPLPPQAITPFDSTQPTRPRPHKLRTDVQSQDPGNPTTMPTHTHTGYSALSQAPQSAPTSPLLTPYTSASPQSSTSRSPNPFPQQDPVGTQDTTMGLSSTDATLPQSFLEKDVMANIRYELILCITHGRLSSESRVSTPLVYSPIIRPPIMPLARQIAYRRRELPAGPNVHPECWQKVHPVTIRGMYLTQYDVELTYTLYLAKPLSYVRGTVIPCYLEIESSNSTALNVLADPRSPSIRLKRSIRYLMNHGEDLATQVVTTPGYSGYSSSSAVNVSAWRTPTRITDSALKLAQAKTARRNSRANRRQEAQAGGSLADPPGNLDDSVHPFVALLDSSDEEAEQVIGNAASWYMPQDLVQERNIRRLVGEIQLPKNLQPSCAFPIFNILYRVEILAPASHAFDPDVPHLSPTSKKGKAAALSDGVGGGKGRDGRQVYAHQLVEIATDSRPDEPTPLSFARHTA